MHSLIVAITLSVAIPGAACGAGGSGTPQVGGSGGSTRSGSESGQSIAAALGSALTQGVAKSGAPGAQGALYVCGSLVWASSNGVLDRASGRAVNDGSRFVLESVTKLFTATMVMQLIQQGRLSLDTPLSQFYPQLPNASSITVKMLVNHTSGLPDYDSDPAVSAALNDPKHVWSRDEVIAALHTALFSAGSKYRYTNSNYVVLGGIAEKVTGTSVEQLFQSSIAAPVDLQHSSFVQPPDGSDLFAHPYSFGDSSRASDGWVDGYGISSDTLGPVWTDGGLISTATDIAHFGDALFTGHLVSAGTLAQMTAVDSNGEGLGPENSQFDGRTWLGHSGSHGGFESELWFDGTREATLAVTTNMDEKSSASDTTSGVIWSEVATALDRIDPLPHVCQPS